MATPDTQTQLRQFQELLDEATNIVALTGAGISTSAGIPDFRGPRGLYITKKYDADLIFDIYSFRDDPLPFYEFAHDFLALEERIQPTLTHRFLARLEQEGKLKATITQNIDALHQRAGNKKVIELHGSFWTSHCLKCGHEWDFEAMKARVLKHEHTCTCGGVIKPDIVFFGENVKGFNEAVALVESCDLLLVLGTSCVVYPAASLPTYASGKIAIINKGRVGFDQSNVALRADADLDEFVGTLKQ